MTELHFPGLVRLGLVGTELVVAACPVDATTTWVAARYYRPRVGRGLLARLVSWLAVELDLRTAQYQDTRILGSIRPRVGSPRANIAMGGDKPISLWYRRWRSTDSGGNRVSRDGPAAKG